LTLLPLLLALAASTTTPDSSIHIAGIEARLFYTDRGTLSPNILDRANRFAGWNTIIGEGPSGGTADDVVIVVAVDKPRPAGRQAFVQEPLTITAMHSRRVIGSRVVKQILVPRNGPAYAALWLKDVGCAGKIVVNAHIKGSEQSATLNMDCGE
jgi:hypothetical protein